MTEPDPQAAPLEAEPADAAIETSPASDTNPASEPVPAADEDPVRKASDPGAGDETGAAPVDTAAPEPDASTDQPLTAAPAAPADQVPAKPHEPRTAGRFVADALRAAGVRYAFTVPGESFLGVLDALGDAGIRVVATRHEGAAAFMAEAYGQLTGRPAACLATRAVGAGNLAIGIHTARQDSTPVIAIVGQVRRDVRGREAFQEADNVGSVGALAKWAAEPTTAAELATAVQDGLRRALGGRPGPVLLSLPEDLLDEQMPDDAVIDSVRTPASRPSDEDVRAVLHLLTGAERPLILAGAGVLRARTSSDLTRFAELVRVPVVASWRRGDVISNEHPLYLGMAGLGAPSVVRERIERADALLVIGSRLSEPTTFGYTVPGAGTRWAHVDLEPTSPPGIPPADLAIAADARSFLRAAIEWLIRQSVLDVESTDRRAELNGVDRAAWEAATIVDATPWSGPGVHPGRTITTLRNVLPDEAIVTTDAGNFAGWLNRGFRFRRPGTFLGPTSGAMGYGLPAAIAAALVHRDRPVVAIVGDGGLAMTMAELETAVRERVRLVVLAFDNERYGTIRMWQDRRGSGQGVATELGAIDFAAIARACGARGARVEHDAEFEPALRQALAADRPTVIQLALDRAWVSVDETPAG